MGFYSSWGRQFQGKGRPDPSHDVEVLNTSTGLVAAKCRTCGWRSVGTTDFDEADDARRRHEEQAVAHGRDWSGNLHGTRSLTASDIEAAVERQYGDVEVDVGSQDWVEYLVGSPNEALEELLNEHRLVVQAAMAGETCPDMRLLPDDPGDASRAALASAWAPDTSASELEKTRHWSQQRPGTSCLPLSPGYCPSLHAFLEERNELFVRAPKHEPLTFASSVTLVDAGLVAARELEHRERLAKPASQELARLAHHVAREY